MKTTKTASKARAAAPDPFAPEPRQPELTPANDDTAGPPDAARTAIAIITSQLSEFDRVEAGIGELERKFKNVVYAVDTPKGMREACESRAAINKPIYATEHARKTAKAPVLELGRYIDSRAKNIDTRLRAVVNPIDDQIKAQEKKEAERKADLERRVQEIQHTPTQCIGKTAAELQEVLDGLNTLPLETFQEYRPQAAAAQESARQQVTKMLEQARLAEEAAELRRKQEADEKRRADLQAKVDALGNCLTLPYRTSERVQQAIDRLTATPIGDDFAEFAPAAREKKVQVLAQLVDLRDEKKRAEDAGVAARQAAQATMTYPNGAPMFGEHIKENGDRILLKPDGKRSVFCDVDEGDAPQQPAGGVLLNTCGPMGMDDTPQATGSLDNLSDHDRINDEAATRLHRDFGDGGARMVRRVAEGRALEAAHVPVPANRLGPPDFDVVDAEIRQRPADVELLRVVAAHYDVPNTIAADWLRTFDAAAALSQLPLPEAA